MNKKDECKKTDPTYPKTAEVPYRLSVSECDSDGNPTLASKYFIAFTDGQGSEQVVEVDREVFSVFRDSELEELRYRKEVSRHIDQFVGQDELDKQTANASLPLEQVIERRELYRRLYRAMSLLTQLEQKRLIMFYFYGRSYADIQRLYGRSYSAIKESISSALIKLRKKLSDD